jgi:predicted HTH domain antitoxin
VLYYKHESLFCVVKYKDAEGLLMKTLSINLPDTVELDAQEARLIIASKLYEQGKLSLGEAAELSGFTKNGFIDKLGILGVSVFNVTAEELANDFQNA